MTLPPTDSYPPERVALGISLRIAAMVCIAILSALVKWTLERGVPLFEVILFRNIFGFLPLGLYIWRTTGFSGLATRRPLGHLARVAAGLVGMATAFASFEYLPLTEGTALQFAAPLFMTALSALLLFERVGRHRWAAVVVGFLGVLVMARPIPGHMNLIGFSLAICSAFAAAVETVVIRKLSDTEHSASIVFYFSIGGLLIGLVGSMFAWVTPDLAMLGLLALLGLVGSTAQLLMTESLRLAPIGAVAPFDYTQLVWAALLGLFIWGEIPQPLTVVGAMIVAGSGVYIVHREMVVRRAALNAGRLPR